MLKTSALYGVHGDGASGDVVGNAGADEERVVGRVAGQWRNAEMMFAVGVYQHQ